MYGFRSEGLRVKTLPCYSRCTSYFSATKVRVPNPYGFRKCSDCKRIAPGKASTPAGMFLGKRAERFGCWASPGRQKRELWAIHPFSKGTGAPTGMAPAQETACLNGGTASALFLLHYDTHRVGATLHFSEDRLQRRGRRSRGVSTPGGVSQLPLPGGMPDQEKCLLDVCYLSLHCQRL